MTAAGSIGPVVPGTHDGGKPVPVLLCTPQVPHRLPGIEPGPHTGETPTIRDLSKKYPTLGQENKVLYLGGYNTNPLQIDPL
jgi:hypothetical protein